MPCQIEIEGGWYHSSQQLRVAVDETALRKAGRSIRAEVSSATSAPLQSKDIGTGAEEPLAALDLFGQRRDNRFAIELNLMDAGNFGEDVGDMELCAFLAEDVLDEEIPTWNRLNSRVAGREARRLRPGRPRSYSTP